MLRDYMESMVLLRETMSTPEGLTYSCIEDFVLTNGRVYEQTSMPKILRDELMAIRSMPIKQCFANCQELAMRDSRFTYVEGYALSIIPVLHAWLEIEGHLFDPTWRPVSAGSWEGREYFGVQFPDTSAIRRRVIELGEYRTMLDDWQGGYQLLREERRHGQKRSLRDVRQPVPEGDEAGR